MFNTLAGKFGGFAGGSSGGLTFSYAPAQTGLTGLTVQKNDSNYWLIGGSHPGGDSPSNGPNSGFYVFTTASDFTGRISMWGGGGPAYRVPTVGGGGAYVQTTHTFSAGNTYKAYVGGSGEGTFIFLKGGPSPSTAFNPVDTLVVVAGGGGQSGADSSGTAAPGGAGGYPSGAAGTNGTVTGPGPYGNYGRGGGGGTQSTVGAGGTGGPTNADGTPGAFIYQATGGSGGGGAGRGGGGYYGGGGGEGGSYGGPNPGSGSGGGGGGGSSHANSAVTSSTTHSSGSANTAGGSPTRPNPSPYWGLQGGYGIGQQKSYTGGPTSPQYNSWAVIGNRAKSAIFIDDVS